MPLRTMPTGGERDAKSCFSAAATRMNMDDGHAETSIVTGAQNDKLQLREPFGPAVMHANRYLAEPCARMKFFINTIFEHGT